MGDRGHFFTSGEVQQLVGTAQHTLSYWDRTSVVRPHGMPAQGKGSRRLYTILDVIQLKIIKRLREAGVSLQKIRRALEVMAGWPDEPAPLAELEVMTDGRQILVRRTDESLVDVLSGQMVLRLSVADLLAEVRDGIDSSPFVDNAIGQATAIIGEDRP